MNFNSIWLKNRLYYSQIEQFSFDLAIECLVDTFLFHPFSYPLELITEVSHVVQVRAEGPKAPEAARPERAEAPSPGHRPG